MEGPVEEYCERCKSPTVTSLPPSWARRIGAFLLGFSAMMPFLAPFLASDPVVTIVSFLALGMAAGPVAMILRTRGSCADCYLDRSGYALKRMGLRRFLFTASHV